MILLLFILLSCPLVRDHHGRILRSREQVIKFERATGFKHGRPGYVVDHVCPLDCGGLDRPINMQWQTIKEGHLKDRWERTKAGCKKLCTPQNSPPCARE